MQKIRTSKRQARLAVVAPLILIGALAATSGPVGAASTGSRYLDGVACTTTTSCVAVGYSYGASGTELPIAEVWNGTAWSRVSVPTPAGANSASLNGVSCGSASSCTAVGSYRNGTNPDATWPALIEHWDGATWTEQAAPAPATGTGIWLWGVACPTATSCTAVGNLQHLASHLSSAIVEHWNGSTWATQSFPGGTAGAPVLVGVSCTSAISCVAVGSRFSATLNGSVPLAGSWNGKSWSLSPAPAVAGAQDTYLMSVSCTSSAACMASGYYDPTSAGGAGNVAEQLKGTTWTIESSPDPAGKLASSLDDVSCTTASACTAVGTFESAATLADRWNGTTWSRQATVKPATAVYYWFSGVSCLSASSCTAVGQWTDQPSYTAQVRPLVEHWNGSSWTVQQA